MDALAAIGKALGILAVIGLIVWLVIVAVKEQERWEQWCFDQGGRVDSTSQWIPQTTYDSKGTPHTTTSVHYTYYCLTEDGRLLDVKG